MLGTLILWRALAGDTYGLQWSGVLIVAIVVGTVVWNLIP